MLMQTQQIRGIMTEPKTAAEYLDRGCDKDDQ